MWNKLRPITRLLYDWIHFAGSIQRLDYTKNNQIQERRDPKASAVSKNKIYSSGAKRTTIPLISSVI